MVIFHAGSYRIRFGLGLCLGNQLAEGGQGSELTIGKQLVKLVETIRYTRTACKMLS